jgi:prepilin-type N-terminal cleavage/methylation domain-containing protein
MKHAIRSSPRVRPGFTLIELLLSLGITALVMTALGSAVVLASRAIPTSSAVVPGALAAALAAEEMSHDLRFATRIVEAEPTRIAFYVPDRTGSGRPEEIVYQWGGPGEPLLRTINSGNAVALVASLDDFAIGYAKRRRTSGSTTTTALIDSGEVLLSSFTGWPGVSTSMNYAQLSVNSSTGLTNMASQKFVVDKVVFPDDIVSWRITRVSLRTRRSSNPEATARINIHLPLLPGSDTPGPAPVGDSGFIAASVQTTSAAWRDVFFNDVVFADRTLRDFMIVMQPHSSTDISFVEYYTATNPPRDEYVFLTSNDSGVTWSPSANRHRNDAPFFVYGSYQRLETTTVDNEYYILGHLTISLRWGARGNDHLTTGVQFANQPEMPAP